MAKGIINMKRLRDRDSLAHVKRNQIKMMAKRGYPLDDEDLRVLEMDNDTLIEYYLRKGKEEGLPPPLSMNKVYTKIIDENGDPSDEGTELKNLVYFVPIGNEITICMDKINPIIAISEEMSDVKHIDVIALVKLYPNSATALKKVKNRDIISWYYQELEIDPFESVFVPKYRMLTTKEQRNIFFDQDGKLLLKKMSNIGLMRKDDIIAKMFRATPGKVLEYIYNQWYVNSMVTRSLEFVLITNESIGEMTKTLN